MGAVQTGEKAPKATFDDRSGKSKIIAMENQEGSLPDYHTYNVDNDHVERNGLNLHYL